MNSNSREILRFKNSEIFEFWLRNKRNVSNYIKGKIPYEIDSELSKLICTKSRNLSIFIKRQWDRQCRNEKGFRKYNKDWLGRETILFVPKKINAIGRPKTTYVDSGERNKRRLASELASQQGDNTQLLVHAASISAKKSHSADLTFVLQQVVISLNRPSKIRKVLNTSHKEVTPISPEEALTFLLENGLTKQQYKNMRQLNNQIKKLEPLQYILKLLLPSTSQEASRYDYTSDSDESLESLNNYSLELEAEENEETFRD
ncbi:uncharacterized protein LOC133335138 [Musca vetustissima]|uniref:uncharacterized protein LOC133335138 n=1 Tax=Musca vetustissima TaxID=27455 RepID=UPI002AB711AC|nr:uncharacterized protein LOC133335138 [Musca vetustissima]